MSKYVLWYLDVKQKGFNKKTTLNRFLTKVYKPLKITEKKNGVFYMVKEEVNENNTED